MGVRLRLTAQFFRGTRVDINMKCKILIRAYFNFEVVVEAPNEQKAKGMASNELMDFLDSTLRDSQKFAQFHEYQLKEEILSIEVINEAESEGKK
jgi:hypothetical protein